eukprot:TRINITY_DN50121_c0_g1_i1.p1 TRINITY_DN50121_c0_g1~~TRINITY_DN50121_c0_g1_i1.p1  ORF type:complete len:169 (+),score=16.94 TRINITY_DN50121_c0_g1_i1:42-509(+)
MPSNPAPDTSPATGEAQEQWQSRILVPGRVLLTRWDGNNHYPARILRVHSNKPMLKLHTEDGDWQWIDGTAETVILSQRFRALSQEPPEAPAEPAAKKGRRGSKNQQQPQLAHGINHGAAHETGQQLLQLRAPVLAPAPGEPDGVYRPGCVSRSL